jgi:hypothetical protein
MIFFSRRDAVKPFSGLFAIAVLFACERREGGRSGSAAIRSATETLPPGADDGATAMPPATSVRAPSLSVERTNRTGDAGDDVLRVVPFAWRPPGSVSDAYSMDEPEDQHQLVLVGAVRPGSAYPVIVAFHGQPKRGEAPRRYAFRAKVMATTAHAVERGDVRPLLLVLPVFRYLGTNWPEFDVAAFRGEIDRRLAELGIQASSYYAVGHSGAAGCGGDGMNRVHRMRPAAVGFFDTCLGRGWRDEVRRLREARIPTLMIHSLETAAFSPRQPIEYSPTFDFGRAYGPAGLAPVECPAELPKAELRDQPFRCSADEHGLTRGLIVDSGEGEEGHNALVPIAMEYFLKQHLGSR